MAEVPGSKGCDRQHEVQLKAGGWSVLQGRMTGLTLLSLFANDLDDRAAWTLSKLAGDAKLEEYLTR